MKFFKKKLAIWLTSVIAAAALASAVYHYSMPKVVLANQSSNHYDELVVQLPSSRVSIGPIPPGASELVYFSPQDSCGELRYSLQFQGNEQAQGTLAYDAKGQFFRVIRIVIRHDGTVAASLSG